jgi:mannose-6-phosphate isomerase-like protein (cupin superfamily)
VNGSGISRTSLDLDTGERFASLRRALDLNAFGMNLLVLAPGQRGRVHDHERQEEVYLVWEGTLTLLVENEPHELERGDVARVGPGTRRQLVNRGPGRCAVVALGAAGEHVGRDGRAWASWDDTGEGATPQDVPLPADVPPDERR